MDLVLIQPKFAALLENATALFAGQESHADKDRELIERLRVQALTLAKDVSTPGFDLFLAYLLGTNAVDAHYPLQAIRMLCLVAQILHVSGETSRRASEDVLLAAFLSDIGFRAAWLGQKGSHAELSAYRLRDLRFSWLTPTIEKLMLFHHDTEHDGSPHKSLSLSARYLSLAYGMGDDAPTSAELSPAKAIESMMEDRGQDKNTVKFLVQALSAFPLGSWVELSNGQTALVIGRNNENPVRPVVGYGVYSKRGDWQWQTNALQRAGALHVVREILPDQHQRTFVDEPVRWIAGWKGQGTQPVSVLVDVFPIGSVTPPGSEQRNEPSPLPHLPGGIAPQAGLLAHPGSDDELKRLRADWEKHVVSIESSIHKLRDGLIESYRRENEYFKTMRQHPPADEAPRLLPHEQPPPSENAPVTAPANTPLERLVAEIENAFKDAQSFFETRQMERTTDEESLKLLLNRTRHQVESRLAQQPTDAHKKALAELDAIESQLVDTLSDVFGTVSADIQTLTTKTKSFLNELRVTSQDSPAFVSEHARRWREDYWPEFGRCQQAVTAGATEHHRRTAKILKLLEGYQSFFQSERL